LINCQSAIEVIEGAAMGFGHQRFCRFHSLVAARRFGLGVKNLRQPSFKVGVEA